MIINKNNNRKGLRVDNRMGCPLTQNRTLWCFALCTPDDNKNGFCGRVAPFGIKGKTQSAIEGYNKKKGLL